MTQYLKCYEISGGNAAVTNTELAAILSGITGLTAIQSIAIRAMGIRWQLIMSYTAT